MKSALVLLLLAGTAHADRSVLPAHHGLLQAFGEVSLSAGATAAPISIAPDLWYGLSDNLTLGAVHTTRAFSGFLGGDDEGFCVTGQSNGCEAFYSTAGVDARYQLKDGALSLAADTGLFAHDLLPMQLALKVGAIARWRSGSLAVEAAPAVALGLTGRRATSDTGGNSQLNEDWLYLPVTVLYGFGKLSVGVQTGVQAPFEPTTSDVSVLTVPVSLAVHFVASDKLFVEGAFTFPRLVHGPKNDTDTRVLTVGGGYAF